MAAAANLTLLAAAENLTLLAAAANLIAAAAYMMAAAANLTPMQNDLFYLILAFLYQSDLAAIITGISALNSDLAALISGSGVAANLTFWWSSVKFAASNSYGL